jgi:hypothetical protein
VLQQDKCYSKGWTAMNNEGLPMKAVRIHSFDGLDVLKYENIPVDYTGNKIPSCNCGYFN